jgi:release factor glutamine methyltransferase
MESHSLAKFTKKFFEDEKEFLEKTYPGISLSRLMSELEHYSGDEQQKSFFASLKKGVPLEYIRNRAYFYRSEFLVNSNVLIPRNETEILVEQSAAFAKSMNKKIDERFKFVDIGTGSGAIALSLIQELDFPVDGLATDISLDALEVAKKNNFFLRFKYSKDSKMEFVHTDRLTGITEKFHLIVSNPPYIKESDDRHKVHQQVETYEPHLALYLKDEEYDQWFNDFFNQVQDALLEEGMFYMEGHEDHLQALKPVLEKFDFDNVEVVKDYTGRDRFLKGIKKCKSYS